MHRSKHGHRADKCREHAPDIEASYARCPHRAQHEPTDEGSDDTKGDVPPYEPAQQNIGYEVKVCLDAAPAQQAYDQQYDDGPNERNHDVRHLDSQLPIQKGWH